MKKKVVVLLQGISSESAVSKITGEAIYDALCKSSIVKDLYSGVEKYYLDEDIYKFCNFLYQNHKDIIIFNALHGKFGEDGRIQGMLDLFKINYTHSGVLASSLGMNKIYTKNVLKNLDTSIYFAKDLLIDVEKFHTNDLTINYPFVIKPIDEGSSVGIYLVNNELELNEALKKLSNFKFLMAEEYIKGVECTVGVLNCKALCVTEIIPKNIFYDYESKYSQGGSQHILPARLEDEILDKMKLYAEKLYKFLNIKSCFRVDFIYCNNKIYFLEINTQPGMTPSSLLPEQANFCNISFEELCLQILKTSTYDR